MSIGHSLTVLRSVVWAPDRRRKSTVSPPYTQNFKLHTFKDVNTHPSTSGLSNTSAYPPSPIGDNPSVHHLPPPLPPPANNSSCHVHWWEPLCAAIVLCFTVLFGSTVGLKIFYPTLFGMSVCFMYFLCGKHDKPMTEQWYITNYASWVPCANFLDLQTVDLQTHPRQNTLPLYRGLPLQWPQKLKDREKSKSLSLNSVFGLRFQIDMGSGKESFLPSQSTEPTGVEPSPL